ncbi:class I SAM-dependent methyltransferase [Subtercola endophyticus]|uniref:class I SAM-dependent methyltransferase n=1 Tax=Subtercola endophyticus TaxID=2895559 RepID=UPI001E48EDA7|nr:class I SAM-dependent methyltransferase [Subtercola endophyticus]UFS59026.1 methyltransferase domain-containing protein [Subtercola endophyticus]
MPDHMPDHTHDYAARDVASAAPDRSAAADAARDRGAAATTAPTSHPAASHPVASHSAASHPVASHSAASHPVATDSTATTAAGNHPDAADRHAVADHPAAADHPASVVADHQHPAATTTAADPATMAPEQFWNARYGESDQIWSGQPNPILVRESSKLAPTTALDLGCGEGADAIWLAEQGWHVTAVDISTTALDRGRARAAVVGVADRIDWQQHDLSATFASGSFGLVSAQFLQSPVQLDRERILQNAVAAVAPNGCLVVVGHAEFPAALAEAHPDVQLPSAAEVLDSLRLPEGEWITEIVAEESREASGVHAGMGTLVDSVVVVRRRA